MFMKSQFAALALLCLLVVSCSRDCQRKVVEMDLVPLTTSKTAEEAPVNGYYESDVMSGSISFVVNFTHQGAGGFCDYFWISYPVEDGMRIIAGEPIVLENDSIGAHQDISSYFDITNLEEDYTLQYLITSKFSVPDSGRYELIGELELDSGEILRDRTIIEMKPNPF
jgi:hypothetical protein